MHVRAKILVGVFWLASAITVAILTWQGPAWWDTDVYWTAIRSLQHGGDPYTEGVAQQQTFHDRPNLEQRAKPPMTYVYSPMTLPVLRLLGHLPAALLGVGYYLLLLSGFLLQLWAVWQMATPAERKVLPFLFPAVGFFPGLLNDDVLLSGNVAYLLYGIILAAAVPGWKRNRWGLYYAAVLAASCCKAPMLSLLAFPVFLGRRQWAKAAAIGLVGVAMFASQAWIWPQPFSEYLHAVNLQFEFNADFGFSPAGLIGHALKSAQLPYATASQCAYAVSAVLVLAALAYSRHRIGQLDASKSAWIPVLLVGTILLNPRVKEYDVAAVTLPLVLILGRSFSMIRTLILAPSRTVNECVGNRASGEIAGATERAQRNWEAVLIGLASMGWMFVINVSANGDRWKPIECVLLLLFFGIGIWSTNRCMRETVQPLAPPLSVCGSSGPSSAAMSKAWRASLR